jgi:hypothetical protein
MFTFLHIMTILLIAGPGHAQTPSSDDRLDKAIENQQLAPAIHDTQMQQKVLDRLKSEAADVDKNVDPALKNILPGLQSVDRLIPAYDVASLTLDSIVSMGGLNTRIVRTDWKAEAQLVWIGGLMLGRKSFTLSDGTQCSMGLSLTVTAKMTDGTILTSCIQANSFETENHFDSEASIVCMKNNILQNPPNVPDPLLGVCTK